MTTRTATNTNAERAGSRLVTIHEVADRLGVEVRHIRRLVHERRIPYIKWGHLLRFDPVDIDQWIDTNRHPAAHPLRR
jgi:excisionase family DNA binding protein